MTGFGGAVLEGVLTFLLVYTVHVVGVSNGGKRGFAATALGALAVGLTYGGRVRARRRRADGRVHEPGALLRRGGRQRPLQEPGRVLGRPYGRRRRRGAGVPDPGVPGRGRVVVAARQRRGGGRVTHTS